MTYDEVLKLLHDRFGGDAITPSQFRDNQRVTVPAEGVLEVQAHFILVAQGNGNSTLGPLCIGFIGSVLGQDDNLSCVA